jgi:hypothetical protein
MPNRCGRFGFVEIEFVIIEFSFFWRASKTFESEGRFQVADGADFQEGNSICLQRFQRPFPIHHPLWKEKFLPVDSTILNVFSLSMQK